MDDTNIREMRNQHLVQGVHVYPEPVSKYKKDIELNQIDIHYNIQACSWVCRYCGRLLGECSGRTPLEAVKWFKKNYNVDRVCFLRLTV